MKQPLYSIRDVHNGFLAPMVDSNDNTAKRNFAYAINNNDSMAFAPKDFDLYKIGEWNVDTGTFEALPVPVLIMTGVNAYGE